MENTIMGVDLSNQPDQTAPVIEMEVPETQVIVKEETAPAAVEEPKKSALEKRLHQDKSKQ